MPHPEVPHPDPDDLALVALGETLDDAAQSHVDGCATCTEQVETFRSTIDLAGLSDYGRDAPAPAEHVWMAIADELGFTRHDLTAVDAEAPQPSPAADAHPRHRWRRWVAPIAAAAVGVAIGAGGVLLVQNRADSVTVDAMTALSPVAGGPLPPTDSPLGTAELVTARSGEQVRVDATGLPAAGGTAFEVWLLGDDGRMVSLGVLADGTGSFTVPAGIDTNEYRTVDISDEPLDGDPTHSGISLVRGTFA
ncbi:MAG TPA: anti-sigma factor [Nakamurella sp.]